MSAEYDKYSPTHPEAVPELGPLRAELQNTAAPDRLKTLVLDRFVDAQTAAQTTNPVSEWSHRKVTPWLGAIAACGAAAIALGSIFLQPSAPSTLKTPVATTRIAPHTKPDVEPPPEHRRIAAHGQRAIQISPTGPIYTRIALPVQTHSLATGPGLRYVNTLTYEDREGLSRALFIGNTGAR